MQWSQRHIQISRCLCPSLVCSGSLPSALQLRWLWFPSWPALPKRPRLPRSALWRAWQPPRVALRWGAMTVRARARHLMLRANPHCHRTRSVSSFQLMLNIRPFYGCNGSYVRFEPSWFSACRTHGMYRYAHNVESNFTSVSSLWKSLAAHHYQQMHSKLIGVPVTHTKEVFGQTMASAN